MDMYEAQDAEVTGLDKYSKMSPAELYQELGLQGGRGRGGAGGWAGGREGGVGRQEGQTLLLASSVGGAAGYFVIMLLLSGCPHGWSRYWLKWCFVSGGCFCLGISGVAAPAEWHIAALPA